MRVGQPLSVPLSASPGLRPHSPKPGRRYLPVPPDRLTFGSRFRVGEKPSRVDPARLRRDFKQWTGKPPAFITFGPNRVNLIGEHTDYNDGYVLPMAMEIGTYAAVRARDDGKVRIRTANPQPGQDAEIIFDLNDPAVFPRGHWGNYVRGTLATVVDAFRLEPTGLDILLQSDGPSSAGLSSSAALETAVGMAALAAAGREAPGDADRMRLALAGQRAEHRYADVQCGIMDQAASALCQPGRALQLDCRPDAAGAYQFAHVPVRFDDAAFVVMDTRLSRKLDSSAYNERRGQCETAVALLKRQPELSRITALRDVSPAQFERYAHRLPPAVRQRAHHVIEENSRVQAAVEALKAGDAQAFGELMNASHRSLKENYDVSGPELDALVETAQRLPGVYGARLTGAGFGGCAVALVKKAVLDQFQQQVGGAYKKRYGVAPDFYVSTPQGGARIVSD